MKKLNNNNGEHDDDDGGHNCGCCASNELSAKPNVVAVVDDEDDAIETENVAELQTILRNDEQDDTIVLDTIVCEPGSRPGDNYMSVVKRVHVRGQRSRPPREYARTMIVKRPILRLSRRQLFRCDEAFANEISAFRRLVPDLRAFSDSDSADSVLPFPRCLFAGTDAAGDKIVLDDLRESGYGMVDRLKGLDFEHSRLVMQKLGTLHGVSVAMRTVCPGRFLRARRQVQEIVYCAEAADFYSTSLNSSVREALSSLRAANRDGDLSAAIGHVERLDGGRMYELMSAAIHHAPMTDDWSVMCHGDLWVNNLMFRYDEQRPTQVVDVKLIDLQTTRCASPAIDILHFIYTSTERAMRVDATFDALLSHYSDALMAEVRRHVVQPEQLARLAAQFTVDSIRRELRSKIMYGLGICMWLLPAVTFHPDRIPDLNTLTMSDFANAKQENIIIQMQTPEYHARLRDVVLEFDGGGYFGSLVE